MRRSWTMTPSASIRRTSLLTSTLTPASASERRATSDSDWGNAGSSRGPACSKMISAVAGSKLRKSFSIPTRESSAMAPASSTPVGPPPTMTKVSSRRRSTSLAATSACSKAYPTPDKSCVFHALEAWRKGCPGVFTEVAMRRAGRDDEVVVGYAEPIGQHLAPLSVDAGHCRQHHLGIELVAENSPYGNGNVTR